MQQLMDLLTNIIYGVMVVLILGAIIVGILYWRRSKARAKIKEDTTDYSGFNRHNSTSFVPFDDIKDDMIITDNGTRFVGVIKCQGFDLYDEDLSTQAATCGRYMGFVNTITKPITYRQFSKPIDLEDKVLMYKDAYEKVESELYNVQEDLNEIAANLKKNLSAMSEEESALYREHLQELEKRQEALRFRAFHLQSQLRVVEMYSQSKVLTIPEETYVFDWKYDELDFASDMTDEEIAERAKRELSATASAKIRALSNCNVRASRCGTMELIDQCRWYSSPISAARYKLRDVMKSSYFDDIVSSTSLHDLREAAVQEEKEKSDLEFLREMKESAEDIAMRAIHSLENVYSEASQEEARLAAGGKLDKKQKPVNAPEVRKNIDKRVDYADGEEGLPDKGNIPDNSEVTGEVQHPTGDDMGKYLDEIIVEEA